MAFGDNCFCVQQAGKCGQSGRINSGASILVGPRESWFPLCTQASLDPKQFGAVGCILIFCEMEERGRVERESAQETSFYLVFYFLSYLLLFAYIKRRKSEITCFHVNINSCSIFLPVHLHTASLSLSFSFFLDFIVVTMEKKDL